MRPSTQTGGLQVCVTSWEFSLRTSGVKTYSINCLLSTKSAATLNTAGNSIKQGASQRDTCFFCLEDCARLEQ